MMRQGSDGRRWIDKLARMKRLVVSSGYPLHRNEDFRPFFIVGSGRCGTTLLRRILQANPQVHIPPETYMLGPSVRFFRNHPDMLWQHLVTTVLGMFEYNKKFYRFGISLRPVAQQLWELPVEQRSLARVLDAIFRTHGEQTGQTFERWGDKTPMNFQALEPILATFPDARFVHLLRDGADVVHSLVQSGLGHDLASAAERWKVAIDTIQEFRRKHPSICCEIRYENLVTDPTPTVEGLCQFLDLEFQNAMIVSLKHQREMKDLENHDHHVNVFRPIMTASIGRGRRALSVEECRHLQPLIGPDLIRLGYRALD